MPFLSLLNTRNYLHIAVLAAVPSVMNKIESNFWIVNIVGNLDRILLAFRFCKSALSFAEFAAWSGDIFLDGFKFAKTKCLLIRFLKLTANSL